MKERADVRLVKDGLSPSREKAQAMIMAGEVYVGERRVNKSSELLQKEDALTVRSEKHSFASRGGHKLEKAVQYFNADVKGRIAMDIGAAAGGFTDVLLRHGCGHVYAIDVGYGQFDWQLRNDSRVTLMERTNARNLTEDMFPLRPNLTVMDVSFISIKLIIPTADRIMGEEGRFLTLVKPQFECGRALVGKNGVVLDKNVHIRVLEEIYAFCESLSLHVNGMTFSPIKGPAGNIEFLADISRLPHADFSADAIPALVQEAHTELKQNAK